MRTSQGFRIKRMNLEACWTPGRGLEAFGFRFSSLICADVQSRHECNCGGRTSVVHHNYNMIWSDEFFFHFVWQEQDHQPTNITENPLDLSPVGIRPRIDHIKLHKHTRRLNLSLSVRIARSKLLSLFLFFSTPVLQNSRWSCI
jgi:hypothetical protein